MNDSPAPTLPPPASTNAPEAPAQPSPTPTITLEWYELASACLVGMRRQLAALRRHLPDRYGCDEFDGWSVHIEGAAGEMAVAKALNQYWNGSVNTFHASDIGAHIQVRTRHLHTYDLIVRPLDSNADAFVLVTGKAPTFTIQGWLQGHHAKQPKYLQTYGGRPAAYFIPQPDLLPISSLHPSQL